MVEKKEQDILDYFYKLSHNLAGMLQSLSFDPTVFSL